MKVLSLKLAASAAIMFTFAVPTQASAHCSKVSGSYVVTCEKGVAVYRHQAKSALPMSLTRSSGQSQSSAKADQRAAVAQQLEARRIRIAEKRQAVEATALLRTSRAAGKSSSSSRRFVTSSGRGIGRSRFHAARIKRVKSKH